MKKLFDLLGAEVFSVNDYSCLGRIYDVLIRSDGLLKIEGFLIDNDDAGSSLKFIHWYDLRFDNNVIMCSMRNELNVWSIDSKSKSDELLFKDDLLDLQVVSNDGREAGFLKDIIISERECTIDGFQCSDGLLNDLIKGRNIYPLLGKIKITDDSIMIGKESFEEKITRSEMEA